MGDEDLTQWLKDLQREFVVRMSALTEEERNLRLGDDAAEHHEQEASRAISTADTEASRFEETSTVHAPGTADTGTEFHRVPTTERSNAGSETDRVASA
jgi:hypothetical protein